MLVAAGVASVGAMVSWTWVQDVIEVLCVVRSKTAQ